MTKLATIIGILVLLGVALAVPVMAWGPHWGGGQHMMGYWGNGSDYGRDARDLTAEQRSKLDALDRKFYEETRELRDQIWTKSRELDVTLNATTPDLEKAKTIQKDISELRSKLDEKELTYDLEARKIVPDTSLGYGYGRHMGGYGYGMGYGHGYCWD